MALNFKRVKAAKPVPGNLKRPPGRLGKQKSNERRWAQSQQWFFSLRDSNVLIAQGLSVSFRRFCFAQEKLGSIN